MSPAGSARLFVVYPDWMASGIKSGNSEMRTGCLISLFALAQAA